MLSRRTSLLITAAFVTLIVSPGISAFVAPSSEEFENRRLAPFPELTLESVADLSFFRDLAAYVSDHTSVRTLGIRAAAYGHYRLLGESPNPNQVLLGEDEWLFSRETFEDSCDAGPAETRIAGLLDLVDSLESMGKTVVYMVAPDKMNIYPGQLTPVSERLAACSITGGLENEIALEASARGGYVDSWSILRSGAEHDLVYFRTDSHFNHVGNRLLIEKIVGLVSPDTKLSWAEAPGEHYGNLMRTIGLSDTESVMELRLKRTSDPIRVSASDTRFSPDSWATEVWESPDPLVGGSILVLKDSFFDLGMEDFAAIWTTTTFTDLRSPESASSFFAEAARHDVILIETAEHALPHRFGSEGSIALMLMQ